MTLKERGSQWDEVKIDMSRILLKDNILDTLSAYKEILVQDSIKRIPAVQNGWQMHQNS